MSRFSVRFILCVMVGICACLACLKLGPSLVEARTVPTIPFDAELWREADLQISSKPTVRSKMIVDLLKTHEFIGWPKSEVTTLLGEPKSSQLDGYGLTYLVGTDRGFGIDFEWLVFEFNKSNEVESVELLQQ